MKKLGFVLLAIALVSSCTQAQSQSDFYGTWEFFEWEFFESVFSWDDEITLTEKTITLSFKYDYEELPELFVSDILSWESIVNNNDDTKDDFPVGYVVKTSKWDMNFYLHKNKNYLLNRDFDYNVIYARSR